MEKNFFSFWGFAVIAVISICLVITIFMILLAMPHSKLRGVTLEIFGITISFLASITILIVLISPLLGDEILAIPAAGIVTMGIVSVIQGRKTIIGVNNKISTSDGKQERAIEFGMSLAVDEKKKNYIEE